MMVCSGRMDKSQRLALGQKAAIVVQPSWPILRTLLAVVMEAAVQLETVVENLEQINREQGDVDDAAQDVAPESKTPEGKDHCAEAANEKGGHPNYCACNLPSHRATAKTVVVKQALPGHQKEVCCISAEVGYASQNSRTPG